MAWEGKEDRTKRVKKRVGEDGTKESKIGLFCQSQDEKSETMAWEGKEDRTQSKKGLGKTEQRSPKWVHEEIWGGIW
jgi:hypothetical protein